MFISKMALFTAKTCKGEHFYLLLVAMLRTIASTLSEPQHLVRPRPTHPVFAVSGRLVPLARLTAMLCRRSIATQAALRHPMNKSGGS